MHSSVHESDVFNINTQLQADQIALAPFYSRRVWNRKSKCVFKEKYCYFKRTHVGSERDSLHNYFSIWIFSSFLLK